MVSFAVFFADKAAVGITRVEALDAAAAEAQVLDQHPGGRVHAVDGALVSGENRVRMLAGLQGLGVDEGDRHCPDGGPLSLPLMRMEHPAGGPERWPYI